MRTLLVLALTSLAVVTASAQDSVGKGHHRGTSDRGATASKPKADEKAYKNALKNIPDGGKFDPWHTVRP